MTLRRVPSRNLWRRPLDVRVDRGRQRSDAATGWVGAEFFVKIFPASGRPMVIPGRVRNSSTTFQGTVTGEVAGTEGARMQAYWKFQSNIDVGGFSTLRRITGVGALANSRVVGTYNIIQSFDLEPPARPGGGFTAHFRNMRGDERPRGRPPWTWSFNNSRTVRRADVVTSTQARLATSYSGSLSAEATAAVGGEVGWDLGPTITVNGSAGGGAGGSINIEFRRDYELRFIGNVHITSA